VLLNQRINFSSAATASSVANAGAAAGGAGQNGGRDRAADGKPGLERITGPGPFSMESETYDSGRLASHERMKAANLTLNQASGTLVARGPGWIERIGPGSAMQKLPGASNAPANGAANAPAGPGLIYLKVDFQNAMRANLADRQVDCQEQVRIVYGPITAWTQIVDPDRLGPQDVWMRCDSVTVREMQNGAAKAHELDAAGDVQIEGARFDASAARLLYDDAKDWLILEGDGRIDAVLKQRGNAGESQPQVAARKINYWIKEDRVKFEDLRAVDAGTIPTSRRRP
ncbi:MAG TPA: LptA/OstA family protein, partial [Pirellulales bacterium]